ncbi:MAG: LysR family transcriptional regulator [bacterium]
MTGHPAFNLDWNLVRTFVAVGQGGSLAAGARTLGITHPTAARHIQQLEETLGMSLFSRTAQGLMLNEAGVRLDAAARVMHDSALAFQAASDSLREQPLQRVTISVADVLAELLPEVLLAELSDTAERPAVSVDMVVTNDLVNLLQRDADLALRNVRPSQQELLCKKLGSLAMGVYAHKEYVATHGMLNLQDLSRHRFIDGLTRDYLKRGAQARGLRIDERQIVMRSDSVPCKRAAVRAGWGIAAFPCWMAEQEPQWVSVLPAEEFMDMDVWLVARPEVRQSEQLFGLFRRLSDSLSMRLS